MANNNNYLEKLKDPRWQKKRLEIFERDNWTCQSCNSKDKTLNIHHKLYIKDTEPWDYPENLLITLCETCHYYTPITIQEESENLINILKEKFNGFDFIAIADAFKELPIIKNPRFTALVIYHLFSNKDLLEVVCRDYESWLMEINKEVEGCINSQRECK